MTHPAVGLHVMVESGAHIANVKRSLTCCGGDIYLSAVAAYWCIGIYLYQRDLVLKLLHSKSGDMIRETSFCFLDMHKSI